MQIVEVIHAFGHRNVLATHRSTLEITKEEHLSREGDCIVAVSADRGLNDFSDQFKNCLRAKNAQVTLLIEACGATDMVMSQGSPQLILTHPTDMVVRKSSHICNRTLAIKADKATCDLSRRLVEKLKIPEQEVKITLTVHV